jgi:hypothetical protein
MVGKYSRHVRRGMHIGIFWESQKEGGQLEDIGG